MSPTRANNSKKKKIRPDTASKMSQLVSNDFKMTCVHTYISNPISFYTIKAIGTLTAVPRSMDNSRIGRIAPSDLNSDK